MNHQHPGSYHSHDHGGPKRLSEKLKDMTKIKLFGRSSRTEDKARQSSQSADSIDDDSAFHLETIDTSPISESDVFFADCENFLRTADNTIDFTKRSMASKTKFDPLKMSQKINKWRAKRKGNKLFMNFDSLLTKSEAVEKDLKQITDQSLNDCTSLLIQATHLRSRLKACVEHNRSETAIFKPYVDMTKDYLEELAAYKRTVELMLVFFDEVMMLKKSQPEPYIPWALRAVSNQTQQKEIPIKKEQMEKRLIVLKEIYEGTSKMLAKDGHLYDVRLSNLDHCEKSLLAMENLLRKLNSYRLIMKESQQVATIQENPIMSTKSTNNSMEDETQITEASNEDSGKMSGEDGEGDTLPPPEPYDHAQCADCSCVYALANDCSMHLAAVQYFAQESTKRLQKLFSVRERMKEKAEVLESIDWGDGIS